MDRMFRLQIYYRAIGNVKRFGVYFQMLVPDPGTQRELYGAQRNKLLSARVPEPLVCG